MTPIKDWTTTLGIITLLFSIVGIILFLLGILVYIKNKGCIVLYKNE